MSVWECEGPKGIHRSVSELAQMGRAIYLGTYFQCHTAKDWAKHEKHLIRQRKFTGTDDEWHKTLMEKNHE